MDEEVAEYCVRAPGSPDVLIPVRYTGSQRPLQDDAVQQSVEVHEGVVFSEPPPPPPPTPPPPPPTAAQLKYWQELARFNKKIDREIKANPDAINLCWRLPQEPPECKMASRNEPWRSLKVVNLRMTNLPAPTTAVDLYKTFKSSGTIIRIEIKGFGSSMMAFVEFSPAPEEAFWNRKVIMGEFPIRIQLWRPLEPKWKKSSVNSDMFLPERLLLFAESLSFGVMNTEAEMTLMPTLSPLNQCPVKVQLWLGKRPSIQVTFHLTITSTRLENRPGSLGSRPEEFRYELPLAHLNSVHLEPVGTDKVALVVPMKLPPLLYKKTRAVEDTILSSGPSSRTWNERAAFYRHTDIADHWEHLVDLPISLRKPEPQYIDFGRWKTYRFLFDFSEANRADVALMCRMLADYNIETSTGKQIKTIEYGPRRAELWDIIDPAFEDSNHSNDYKKMLAYPNTANSPEITLSFPVRYQLEVCLSQGSLNEYSIQRPFVERLAAMGDEAKDLLEKVADTKRCFYDPMEIFGLNYLHSVHRRPIPDYCTYVRSANVTPSTIYYTTPTVETSNRTIRDNSKWADRFLRVKFTDEKIKGRIEASDNPAVNREVFDHVWRTLSSGIVIGDRKYEFLAFGSSQFRENGAYFFASCPERTANDIRAVMGDFAHIKEVARFAARLGQCFSTTRPLPLWKYAERDCFNNFSPQEIRDMNVDPTDYSDGRVPRVWVQAHLEDVQRRLAFDDGTKVKFNFTDGVGKISRPLLEIIAEEFGLPNYLDDPPSLVQFRLGGCKGVLAEHPDVMKNAIQIRPSQNKFDAVSDGLEIVRVSQFSSATLNRQIILCLDALGVPAKVFTDKLEEMLTDLTKAMEDKAVALRLLQRYIDFNQMTLTVAAMILDGFMETSEPFMISVLELWRTWNVKYLKEKAKIFIKDGAFLFGCTDETQTLQGHVYANEPPTDATREERLSVLPEIFVQVSDQDNPGHYKVVTGVCIVARNPSLHPGDIRVVRAVDVKDLHHLKNVVVFPQKGDRDIPNMCSGGDLDGDDYLVIWDPALIPEEINHPAMDFTPEASKRIEGEVTLKQVKTFFINYMKNDSLGQIAIQHLAWADFEDEGVKSAKCLHLAQLHSQAVDYAKSGNPARMAREDRIRSRPHFMEKAHHKANEIYHSKKVLGQLYDQVKQSGTSDTFEPVTGVRFDTRIYQKYNPDSETHNKAAKLKKLYDEAMRRIMTQHSIRTEFEVWTTFVLDHSEEVAKDYGFHEIIGQASAALKERFRKMVYEEVGSQEFEAVAPFIVAMYGVTEYEMRNAMARTIAPGAGRPEEMPLISFPWIFQSELGRIATGDKEREVVAVPAPQRVHKKGKAGGSKDKIIDVSQTEFLELFKRQNEKNGRSAQDNTLGALPREDPGDDDDDAEWSPVKKTKSRVPPVAKSEEEPEEKAEIKPELKPEVEPEVMPEIMPEIMPEVVPEIKPEVKPETKPEVKPEIKQEVKPEAKRVEKPEKPEEKPQETSLDNPKSASKRGNLHRIISGLVPGLGERSSTQPSSPTSPSPSKRGFHGGLRGMFRGRSSTPGPSPLASPHKTPAHNAEPTVAGPSTPTGKIHRAFAQSNNGQDKDHAKTETAVVPKHDRNNSAYTKLMRMDFVDSDLED